MFRIVLWLAAGAVVLLAALAISRGVNFTSGEPKETKTPSVEERAEPAAAIAPEPEPALPVAPPAPPTPDELQVQDDAAATGMTTVEPEDEPSGSPPPVDTPPPR